MQDFKRLKVRFLQMSMGSASELEYYFLLAHELGYLKNLDFTSLSDDVAEMKRMLASLIVRLKADSL
ncbi:MAG: four helix bundle protein [Planctomycetes bacterium]|nr:four helix bundle protein [Planctomycetota bacterium]